MGEPCGFLLVDKPSGPTSHDIIDVIRGAVGIRKVGHSGTLDPMATGLLVVGVGRATRLLRFLEAEDKEYEAVARLGILTDTLDAEGSVLSREPTTVSEQDLASVLPRFVGEIMQVPPMVSALKVGGRRLHRLARSGIEVDRRPRAVKVHRLDLCAVTPGPFPEVSLRVACSKGTYIRTLADDIASAVGTRAQLTALRRTRVGSLNVAAAIGVDEMGSGLEGALIAPAVALGHLPSVIVDADTAVGVCNGMVYAASALGGGVEGDFTVVDRSGLLLAVYHSDGACAKPEVVTG